MSEQQPGPTHTSYGQSGAGDPYGQPPAYGSAPQQAGDRRPGTVTAAAWITVVLSAIVGLLFGFSGLALLVSRDELIAEFEKSPEYQDLNFDLDQTYGVGVAILFAILAWTIVAIVLAVFVLRRSSTARILLVISSAVAALISLVSIFSIISAVPLIAAIATIVLLFTGGAGDWFKRTGSGSGGYPGGPSDYQSSTYGAQPAGPYGGYGSQPDSDAPPAYPSADNPYGQPPSDGTDYPPQNYPGR